jgi:hypothetical protein
VERYILEVKTLPPLTVWAEKYNKLVTKKIVVNSPPNGCTNSLLLGLLHLPVQNPLSVAMIEMQPVFAEFIT